MVVSAIWILVLNNVEQCSAGELPVPYVDLESPVMSAPHQNLWLLGIWMHASMDVYES